MRILSLSKKEKLITFIGLISILFIAFSFWADSPGDIEFYLNRDDYDVFNETNTFQVEQEMYYRFVQIKETEIYQLTVINKDTQEVYNSETLDLTKDLMKETSLSGAYLAPDKPGKYLMKVQDIKHDILVAQGEFNVR